MKNLQRVLEQLKKQKASFQGHYYIPKVWNSFGFEDYTASSDREEEVCVQPHDFITQAIESCLSKASQSEHLLQAFSEPVRITDCNIYSMLPRMFTAWNHYDEKLVSGSFLKAICLLPFLKSLHVDIIYLLPIFKYSNVRKKGEIGSPYAIKNIYQIDENLHDPLLGEEKDFVHIEFKAFMEACHAMGFRVMLDFVFRTVARDSDILSEHPDWFYWIKKEAEKEFKAPMLKGFKKPTVISEASIHTLYSRNDLSSYLSLFQPSPDQADPKKWSGVVARQKRTGENLLQLIEAEFGITTTPGFADVINDPQPAWSDVTYLKMYHDRGTIAADYIAPEQPAYVLYDVAKASVAGGKQPNQELWEYIAGVIPYYQQEYGLDGARIDMGHALPESLNLELVARVKAGNPHFILWSEEFNAQKSQKAKEAGFNFMSGGLWAIYPTIEKFGFYRRLLQDLLEAKIPITAALETPDTPRAAELYATSGSLEMMVFLNGMLPNAVSFLNNGLEMMEKQPMNLGLGSSKKGRFALDAGDPMYGKLAFFDPYMLHWKNEAVASMQQWLTDLVEIRKRYRSLLCFENFVAAKEQNSHRKMLLLLYYDKKAKQGIFFLANRASERKARISLIQFLPPETRKGKMRIIYRKGRSCDEAVVSINSIILQPKEYMIGILEE